MSANLLNINPDYRDKLINNSKMKNALLIVLCFVIMGVIAKGSNAANVLRSFSDTTKPEKKFHVSLPLNQWNNYLSYLNYIANTLRNTDLPSKQTTFITDSLINPMTREIFNQVSAQQVKDTIPTKTKNK